MCRKGDEFQICESIASDIQAQLPPQAGLETELREANESIQSGLRDLAGACHRLELKATVEKSCRRTYRRARRCYRKARKDGDREAIHEFRKRAKELMYQLRMVAHGSKERKEFFEADLKVLAEGLGDFQNQSVIIEAVEKWSASSEGKAEGLRLVAQIEKEQKQFGRRLLSRASRLFAHRSTIWAGRVFGGPEACAEDSAESESAEEPGADSDRLSIHI
jgi:CHAD domain-containing protein